VARHEQPDIDGWQRRGEGRMTAEEEIKQSRENKSRAQWKHENQRGKNPHTHIR